MLTEEQWSELQKHGEMGKPRSPWSYKVMITADLEPDAYDEEGNPDFRWIWDMGDELSGLSIRSVRVTGDPESAYDLLAEKGLVTPRWEKCEGCGAWKKPMEFVPEDHMPIRGACL